MAKKTAKKSVKKIAAKKAVRKVPAPKRLTKKVKETFFPLRSSRKGTLGLLQRGDIAYGAMKSGRTMHVSEHPAIKARGHDHDPNRPKLFFDHRGVEVLGVFDIAEGTLVAYQSAHASEGKYHVALGAALFEVNGLGWRETWRTELPILEDAIALAPRETITPKGAHLKGDEVYAEWQSSKKKTYAFEFPQPFLNLNPDPAKGATLERYENNPIIAADPEHPWEAVATLNPAAVLVDGKIHLFYRAIGAGGRSVFGHALSADGLHFSRFAEPAYVPGINTEGYKVPRKKKTAKELRCPTSGVDGAEDPRATVLEGKLHIMYAAFNGYEQARVAHISADTDGIDENALDWCEPTLLSAPPTHWGTGGKNAALLPAKLDDSYVIFHRIWPDICIDYTPTLDMREFREEKMRWLEAKDRIRVRPAHWDSGKVLVGAPPVETKDGWLLIFNAVSHQHSGGYKIGAMLLDKNDPSKVLYRSKRPILASGAWYEETGHVPRVTYACGAVIKEDTLFVYYGGADTYVNVATANLDDFLTKLKRDKAESVHIEEVRRKR